MSDADVSAGLVLPYAAVALLGPGGAVCTLLIVFMAVTSASSAELIAVSSIFTYDIYQTYFNPGASGKRLIYMSHAMVVAFGLAMASLSTGRKCFCFHCNTPHANGSQCTTPVSAWDTSMFSWVSSSRLLSSQLPSLSCGQDTTSGPRL